MIIYNKSNGRIMAEIPENQPYEYLYDVPLDHLVLEEYPSNVFDFKVSENKLLPLSEDEIREELQYGKILTEEERLYEQLMERTKPSPREIEQAELMIKLLPILQEVMTND